MLVLVKWTPFLTEIAIWKDYKRRQTVFLPATRAKTRTCVAIRYLCLCSISGIQLKAGKQNQCALCTARVHAVNVILQSLCEGHVGQCEEDSTI